MIATDQCHTDIVILLLSYTDINIKDNEGNTVLMMKAASGNKRMVKFLLKNGANINVRNRRKNTALDMAKKYGYRKIERLLEIHPKISSLYVLCLNIIRYKVDVPKWIPPTLLEYPEMVWERKNTEIQEEDEDIEDESEEDIGDESEEESEEEGEEEYEY
jgi:ankyrin repeat protein